MPHTPGPWYTEEPAGGFSTLRQEGTNKLVFFLAYPNVALAERAMSNEEKHANLVLVAAAPELLAAMEGLVSAQVDSNPKKWSAAIDVAVAAIAKARGDA